MTNKPGSGQPSVSDDAARDARAGVLVVEDDAVLGSPPDAALPDDGHAVTVLVRPTEDAVRVAVARLEPDCVLLDGERTGDYGRSWLDAAWAHARRRPVPVVMFSADAQAIAEAQSLATARSQEAHF